jgi:tryptophan halogenase
VDEYNTQTREAIEVIRDFIILHYHVNQRTDSALWRQCREMAVPAQLAHRLQHFRDTARIALRQGELFAENSWVQVMMGQGIVPASHHPITRNMDDSTLADFLGGIRKDVARKLMKLPSHAQFLRDYAPAPRPDPPRVLPAGPALRINPDARLQTLALSDGSQVVVVDDFVLEPESLVGAAQALAGEFQQRAGHPYPGPQLDLPSAMAAELGDWFQRQLGAQFRAGAPKGMYGRFARVTQDPASLDARQRICHRDDSSTEAGDMVCACVHYLFQDATLGGTVFFRTRMSASETRQFMQDANTLDGAAFGRRYDIAPGYMTDSNRYFEVIGRIPAKWNRAVFYDGGIYHSGDIRGPSPTAYREGPGRLTINAFFTSARQG